LSSLSRAPLSLPVNESSSDSLLSSSISVVRDVLLRMEFTEGSEIGVDSDGVVAAEAGVPVAEDETIHEMRSQGKVW
jgi:hypothetical protein